jgi:hypothetical protein
LHKYLVCARFNIDSIRNLENIMNLLITTHNTYEDLCNSTIFTGTRAQIPTTMDRYLSYRLAMSDGNLTYQGFACGYMKDNSITIMDYPLPALYDDFSLALIQYSNTVCNVSLSLYNPVSKRYCPQELLNKVTENWA